MIIGFITCAYGSLPSTRASHVIRKQSFCNDVQDTQALLPERKALTVMLRNVGSAFGRAEIQWRQCELFINAAQMKSPSPADAMGGSGAASAFGGGDCPGTTQRRPRSWTSLAAPAFSRHDPRKISIIGSMLLNVFAVGPAHEIKFK